MFIHEIYVSGELTNMLFGYEIVRFLRWKGEQDVLDMRYQFIKILIVNFKHYYDLWVSMPLTRCIAFREWLFDDVIIRTIIAQYGSVNGINPSYIMRGGWIAHRVVSVWAIKKDFLKFKTLIHNYNVDISHQ